MKKFMKRYRNNRYFGDSIAEALWYALRGKTFPDAELIREVNNNKGDK